MRILLILARDNTYRHNGFIYNRSLYAPLTLSTLAALVPHELGAEIDLIDEGVQRMDYARRHVDVVGITCCASAAPRAYQLAREFRARGTRVVLGGSHPTLNPEEAAQHADAVVAGYAERIWPEILRRVHRGEPLEPIYRERAPHELRGVVPRRDLVPDSLYLTKNTVIASRGCANRCEFCAIHTMWGRSACTRPVEQVMDEIRGMGSRKVLFLDPNLTANRAYAKELFRALIPLGVRWRGLATIDIADDAEMLELAVRSGCTGLLFGFETAEQSNLVTSKKQAHTAHYREAIRRLHQHQIRVLGCFVLGFDHDTVHSFDRVVRFIDEIEVDLTRFSVLTPYPGTDLYRRLEAQGRILTRDWSLYDTEHVVFQPARMSPEELQQGYRRAWRELYRMRRILPRVARGGFNLGSLTSLGGNLIFKYHFPTSKHRSGPLSWLQRRG